MQKIPSASDTGLTNRINHARGKKLSVRKSLDRVSVFAVAQDN